VNNALESGKVNPTPATVAGLLAIYGVKNRLRKHILAMANSTIEDQCTLVTSVPGHPPGFEFAEFEATARTLTEWSPLTVPTMLRTPDYARALLTSQGVSQPDVDHAITKLLHRNNILRSIGYTAYVGTHALTALPFDPATTVDTMSTADAVLQDQLEHLAHLMHTARIHLIPTEGPISALLGPCRIATYPDHKTIVRVELVDSTLYLHDDAATPYLHAAAQLSNMALSEADSRTQIVALLNHAEEPAVPSSR
jgi:hypothetical protein